MEKLAEAVLYWVEYQSCVGIDEFMNESSLSIPIVARLTSQGWIAKKEKDYSKICNSVVQDKCYADFYFENAEKRLVLETKLYKTSPQSKMFDDMLRLALPVDPNVKRLALVVYSKAPKLWGQFEATLELQEGAAVQIDLDSMMLRSGNKEFPLAYNHKEFLRLRNFASVPISSVSVECIRKIEAQKYAAILLSVGRAPEKLLTYDIDEAEMLVLPSSKVVPSM